jgi:hypothetical protein
VRKIVEGSAAHHAKAAVPARPWAAVSRITGIFVIPAILGPFPDIAVHIVESPRIGAEAIDGNGRLAPFALCPAAMGDVAIVVGLVG